MTTKEQERKAMEKIREIVNGLGENSYIGAAMEGVWEIMEENISNDFACSMGYRLEEKEKTITGLREMCSNITKEKREVEGMLEEAQRIAEMAQEETRSRIMCERENLATIKKLTDEVEGVRRDNSDLVMEAANLKDEIIRLKAKLYDLIVGGESK